MSASHPSHSIFVFYDSIDMYKIMTSKGMEEPPPPHPTKKKNIQNFFLKSARRCRQALQKLKEVLEAGMSHAAVERCKGGSE